MAKSTKSASAVDVLDKNGALVRTYSVKVHGKGFMDLAEEFAAKEEGRKIVNSKPKSEDEDEE